MQIQKLVVTRQFMGVEPCEIELRRFLLLIGEQASGKSTIAKLIYFFQTLPDAIYRNTILSSEKNDTNFDFIRHINLIARDKFYETFGPAERINDFEIRFYYSQDSFLKINKGRDNRAYAEFENNFGYEIGKYLKSFLQSPLRRSSEEDEIYYRQELRNNLNKLFERSNTNYTYIIAGRNTTVAFPEVITEKVEQELEKIVEGEVQQQDFEKKRRLGNELLFLQFIEWAKGVKEYFNKNGRTFEYVGKNLNNFAQLSLIAKIAEKILKGKYSSDNWGEQIKIKGEKISIPLRDASSGQQEVLRILQGIFLSIGLNNRREFFIIEEPEAHLFPLAQKELVNIFAIFLNTIKEGKLIITTHSPYILACVNILLFAHYVAKETGSQNGKIGDIQKELWLNPEFFSAYSLGQSEGYCINIKDAVTGLIDQNYLDAISEQLGMKYNELYNILTTAAK